MKSSILIGTLLALVTAGSHAYAHEGTDHEKTVGHFGITYFGLSQIPHARLESQKFVKDQLNVAVVGLTYWFTTLIGVDFGVGFGTGTQNSNLGAAQGLMVPHKFQVNGYTAKVGLALSVAHGKHYTFEIVPDVGVGFATASGEDVHNGGTAFSGRKFDIGLRAGAEIQLGFIGVPEVAVQLGVGLFYRFDLIKGSTWEESFRESGGGVASSIDEKPLSMFANNIAVVYYL